MRRVDRTPPADASFEEALRRAVGTDDALEAELARRRQRALAALDDGRSGSRGRLWLAALPALALVVGGLLVGGSSRPEPGARTLPLRGYEIVLTGPSSLSFYDRLGFYRWLARHEERRS